MENPHHLRDTYRFPGMEPSATVHGYPGNPKAIILPLHRRRKKTVCGHCGQVHTIFYDQRPRLIRDLSCGDKHVYLSLNVRRVDCWYCGKVKTERLDWISELPGYTKRFAFFVGRRCHDTPVKAVAEELGLDWQTVKELDKLYMREQLRRAPAPNPKVIGIDEIFMGKKKVSHRGERSHQGTAYLVRRQGSFGS
jgi:transposase